MSVLAFDTSAGACSAAVLAGDGRVLAARRLELERGHAERLMPMLRDVLAAASVAPAALELLATTTGPGTFTGIRIGLAAARGLALASGVPLVGVTSFASVAASIPPAERQGRLLLVAIDSRRGDFFVAAFDESGRSLVEPAAMSPEQLARHLPAGTLLVAGDGAARAAEILERSGRTIALASWLGAPDAVALGRCALADRGAAAPAESVHPLYLRAPDVTVPHVSVGDRTAAKPA